MKPSFDKLLHYFTTAGQWLQAKINQFQGFLESRFPKLQKQPCGQHAAHVFVALSGMLIVLVFFSFARGSSSTSDSSSETSSSVQGNQEITLGGRTFSLDKLYPFRQKEGTESSYPKGHSPGDVFYAIWNSFYGKGYRKHFYNVQVDKDKKGKPFIFVKDRPSEHAWTRRTVTVENGVTTEKIESSPRIFYVIAMLNLSVNDSVYRQWKDAAHTLLRQFAVSKDEATSSHWLAGMWFGFGVCEQVALDAFKNALSSNNNSLNFAGLSDFDEGSAKTLFDIAKLCVYVEALDAMGNVIVKDGKPLRTCIPLDEFASLPRFERMPLLLGSRPGGIFELGRFADFNTEEQATVKKKIAIEDKTAFIEEVYAPESDIEPIENATDTAITNGALFAMNGYVVTKTVDHGVIATNPNQSDSTILLETPLLFSKGDEIPLGYVKYVAPSSKAGKTVRHFRQVFRNDPINGFHGRRFEDRTQLLERAPAAVDFDNLSEETAKSIANVRCWIEETNSIKE